MGVGMGIHGEPGIEIAKMKTADEIAEMLITRLIGDLPFRPADEVAVLITGLEPRRPRAVYSVEQGS